MLKRFKHADKTTFILFIFILFIFLMFFTGYRIKENMSHYASQSNAITILQLIDRKLYHFTLTANKFTNYDEIDKKEEKFLQTFEKLKSDLKKYNPDTSPLLKDIANSFNKKVEDLEYFKAQNAALINSSHFLFDLQTTISQTTEISLAAKNLTNEILFYLLRYASSNYIDKEMIDTKLDELKIIAHRQNNQYLSTFYRHAKVMLHTLQSLKEVSQEIQANPLYEQISALKLRITHNYKRDLQYQTWLMSAFFLLSAFVLIALIFSHLASNKTKQKLIQAATVFENIEEAIIITDAKGKIVSVNSAFTNIYSYTLHDIKGKYLSFLYAGDEERNFSQELWNQLQEQGTWKGKLTNKTKFQELISVWTTIKKITDLEGNTVSYIAVQTDLRELEMSQAKADYLAYHDSLTGLYNRINFEEYLQHALTVARRSKTVLAILFIDLDRFKIINDTLGHDIGDEVLKAVALRLKNTLRDSDFISRWGGDEFVVILENLMSVGHAAITASKIIKSLEQPIDIDQHSLITTASIGIALYPDNGENSQTLIKHADSAMYLAKERGKNNFQYYTKELSQEIKQKLDIDMSLRNALQNHEFSMVFQPQYELSTKTVHSVEALIRWKNKILGTVPPDRFIPIAEENGMIIPLGYFVFEESCKAFKQMQQSNVPIKYIAVNISTLQLKDADLLDTFLNIATRYNVKPQEIEIEITERFIMEHTVDNMNILQNFRDHGFKISIDDFGTGYSSMSYLKQLPADTIKIDKSFVDDIAQGSSDNVIIEAIIALSKTLGYTIVAEGIETEDQEIFLSSANCDLGQGYLFSRPVTCKEIIENYAIIV